MFVETKFFHKAGEGSGGGGGGGSDPHNLGYYADLTALQTAHPTGTNGDFAILGSTDTIWVWDSGTSAWKDTDTKGQVTSVNGQTGDVVLDLLPSQTGNAEKFLITNGTTAEWGAKLPASVLSVDSSGKGYKLGRYGQAGLQITCMWNTFGSTKGYVVVAGSSFWGYKDSYTYPDLGTYSRPWQNVYARALANGENNYILIPATVGVMAVQVSTMPTAAAGELGKVYQFTGTTDSTYTHGYIYECKAQGTSPETYAWEAVEVQPAGAQINDNSTSLTETWSASKLNTMIGNVETLLAAI